MGRERREFGSIRKLASGRPMGRLYGPGPPETRRADHLPGEDRRRGAGSTRSAS